MNAFEKKEPITGPDGVMFHQNAAGQIVVKTGEVDLTNPEVTGCVFEDREGLNQYELSEITRDIPDAPGEIEAVLTTTDIEYQQSEKRRVRPSHRLREGAPFTWTDHNDEKQTMRTIAKVTAGTVGAVAIGVLTLYKIRNKRSHE